MGSLYRHVEHLSGQYIGGADAAGDHSGAGPVNTGIRTLGPAQAEFHHAVSLGSVDHPVSLCSNQALVVYNI